MRAERKVVKSREPRVREKLEQHAQDPATLEQLYDTEHWYAAYTCANREKLVSMHLASRGIEHFLPLYQTAREWSDRRVTLQIPLFPGYVFVRTSLRRRLPILTVPGLVHLVSVAGQPAPLESEIIEKLRDGIGRVAAQPHPYLPVGQCVSICAGPLKGLTGVLVRHKSGPRVVISIDAIERAFLADVATSDLIPIGPMMGLEPMQQTMPA
jgi:transcriptional antiterminator NusG